MIAHASASSRARRGGGSEVVVVVFSDGKENASRRSSREKVFEQIEAKRKEGWTFVFLGANQARARARGLRRRAAPRPARRAAATATPPPHPPPFLRLPPQDAYASSSGLSMARGATSNFVADARGVSAGWGDLSAASSRHRSALRSGRAFKGEEKAAYLEGDAKDGFRQAERDFAARGKLPTAAGAPAAAGAADSGVGPGRGAAPGRGLARGAAPGGRQRGRRRVLRHRPSAKGPQPGVAKVAKEVPARGVGLP